MGEEQVQRLYLAYMPKRSRTRNYIGFNVTVTVMAPESVVRSGKLGDLGDRAWGEVPMNIRQTVQEILERELPAPLEIDNLPLVH